MIKNPITAFIIGILGALILILLHLFEHLYNVHSFGDINLILFLMGLGVIQILSPFILLKMGKKLKEVAPCFLFLFFGVYILIFPFLDNILIVKFSPNADLIIFGYIVGIFLILIAIPKNFQKFFLKFIRLP